MGTKKKDKRLRKTRFIDKFTNSFDGINYYIKNESGAGLMIFGSSMGILLGIIFQVTFFEWLLIIIGIAAVFVVEFLNTGIEATIDLVSPDYHILAKVAKDTGSAAVLFAFILDIALALYIFIPYIIDLIKNIN